MAANYDDLRERLAVIAEELADLALAQLRDAAETGERASITEEKRLTRARRAVEKAVHLLAVTDDDEQVG